MLAENSNREDGPADQECHCGVVASCQLVVASGFTRAISIELSLIFSPFVWPGNQSRRSRMVRTYLRRLG